MTNKPIALAAAAALASLAGAVELPAGYTSVEYIQSAGGSVNSAYVDTGYTPTSGSFGFFLDFTYLDTVGSSGTRLMGSSAVAGSKWRGIGLTAWSNTGGGGQLVFDNNANAILDPGIVSGTKMWIELKNLHVTSSTGLNTDFSSCTPSYYGNVYVGNAHRETMANGSAMRIYRFKLYNGNTLVHDFVPATNASGVPGLYDIAGDAGFRASATSTAFTAGPEVAPPQPKRPRGKDDLDPEDTSFAGLKIAVLGDSYSDYRSGGGGYYPALGVDSVVKMWYSIVADTLGATIVGSRESNYILGKGGTTVGYMTKETSFHSRVWGLGKNQGADADLIFVFGGANDQAQGAAQGDYLYDPADWNNTTLKDFRPALASLLVRLRSFYPKARVYCIVNAPATSATDIYLQPEFIESTTNICRHLGVPYIELHDIERENRHPTAAGQRAIGEQVADFVANDFTNRARTVYSDVLLWSNDASLERRQIGHEFVYIVTNASKKVRLLFHQPATITEILLVGGGGGGGETIGGGGGGGQVRSVSGPINVEAWSKLVVDVGGGGGGSAVAACERSADPVVVGNYWHYGFSGTESTLICDGEELYSAAGGGGGGGWGNQSSYYNGRAGASGGGGSHGGSGGAATDGCAGGSSTSPGAGGGGGAGGAGTAGTATASGRGGSGVVVSISGQSLEYGAGGGGGAGNSATTPGAAGGESGGAGAAIGGGMGSPGMDGRGGGGGGGSHDGSGYAGGRGGCGTVIIRLKSPAFSGSVYYLR